MSIAANQGRTFLQLLAELSPYIRTDRTLPARLQQRLAKERRFGSRDRRLYRELLYTAIRYWPWIEELAPQGEAAMLRAVSWLAAPLPALQGLRDEATGNLGPTRASIDEKAAALGVRSPLLPSWVEVECPDANRSPNLEVLHERAPLWLRLQTERTDAVFAEFEKRGWSWERSPLLRDAVRLRTESDVTQSESFQNGWVEVQDIGSQWVLAAACASPACAGGERWLDACAGAGGKTLQLARWLGDRGSVVGHDVRPEALSELLARSRRAGLQNVTTQARPEGLFDGVLIDAPCSGSGTWRRSPHLKWQTSGETVKRAAELQLQLLRDFAALVKPGGRLIYGTCSLCTSENEEVVQAFLQQAPEFAAAAVTETFSAEPRSVGVRLWPATLDSDGFYVAAMVRG